MISTRVGVILVCGIIVLFAACMNYRETAGLSVGTDLILFAAILIFSVAGILFRNESG